jgi:tetratricopeptide (TPR) repeat protein
MPRWFTALLLATPLLFGVETAQDIAQRAVRQIDSRDFEGAAGTLRSFLDHRPGDASLWNLLGICESERGHFAAALAAFERGLSLEPGSLQLHENTGLLFYNQGDYRRALQQLKRAVELGSDKPGVLFSLAVSRVRTGDRKAGLADLIRLEKALAEHPDYWAERGWIEMRDSPAIANTSFELALKLDDRNLRALNGAAAAAEAQKEDEKALSFLLRAKREHPDDLLTLLHLASLCLRMDLSVDAREAVARARRISPPNNLALFLQARTEIAFQQWGRSHELFSEFDRRIPNYGPTQYALGWLDRKLDRPGEARMHLQRSLQLDPGNAEARLEAAQLDLDEGKLEAAETHLNLILKQHPEHAKALLALGDVSMKRGDLVNAKSFYSRSIQADAKSGPAHYKLSTVLVRLGEVELAAQERALGIKLNSDAEKAAKTVLVLAEPDGTLLCGEPGKDPSVE